MTVEYFEHPLYSELRASGHVRVQDWVGTPDIPPPVGNRLLVDYSRLEAIDVSVGQLISAAETLAADDIRVAVVAPMLPELLALMRRVMILARVEEGVDVAMFADRQECIAWLTRGLAAAGEA